MFLYSFTKKYELFFFLYQNIYVVGTQEKYLVEKYNSEIHVHDLIWCSVEHIYPRHSDTLILPFAYRVILHAILPSADQN